MSSLAREIEKYLKELLSKTNNGVIEIQRSTLSQFFECVPSQINYVLSTRFTPAHGYMVETRRGGGGYIRIVRLKIDNNNKLKDLLEEIIHEKISLNEAHGIIELLKNQGLLTKRESILLKNILSENVLSLSLVKNQELLRARILQCILATILREDR